MSNAIPLHVALCTKLYYRCFPLYRAIYFAYKKISDRALIKSLKSHISARDLQGGIILDLGANIGFYSRFFAENAPAATIYAVEPEPRNVARLRAEAGGFSQVKIFPAAVADRAGELEFTLSANSVIDHHLGCGAGETAGEKIKVPAVTIDEICAGLPRVEIIKMDIQGAEGLALRGARQTLARSSGAVIVMELFPWGFTRMGDSWEKFIDLCRELRLEISAPDGIDVVAFCRENANNPAAYANIELRVG
ncbi:MAG: FkbM family methyltransferase [Planctomycetota bacterium]|jgi:FkbM family methyltransferase|nr:FkbM family methyltransferase [Planctomycetota bacterium]